MICSKCAHASEKRPRIRCTPTFFHHAIFTDEVTNSYNARCTATYHSTIFDQQPKQHRKECPNYMKQKDQVISQDKTRPMSASQPQEITFKPHAGNGTINAGSQAELSHHTKLWYNPDKQLLLRECSNWNTHGHPHQRKLIEMYSDPFYPYYKPETLDGYRGCSANSCSKHQIKEIVNEQIYKPVKIPRSNSCAGCKHTCVIHEQLPQNTKTQMINEPAPVDRQEINNIEIQDIPKQETIAIQLDNKGTKARVVSETQKIMQNNGSKKNKNLQDKIRKSQPVFKSVTGPRR